MKGKRFRKRIRVEKPMKGRKFRRRIRRRGTHERKKV